MKQRDVISGEVNETDCVRMNIFEVGFRSKKVGSLGAKHEQKVVFSQIFFPRHLFPF